MDFSMPLDEAMRTQCAIRRLKPDPVEDALVLRLIELALKAPSGSNQQNWEFVIVKDRAVKEKLGALNRGMFRFYGGLGRRMAQNQPKMLRIVDAVQWQADHFAEVPVVVVACLRGFRAA
jgi:nitroreductase